MRTPAGLLPTVIGIGPMDSTLSVLLRDRARVVCVVGRDHISRSDLGTCQAIVARGAVEVSSELIHSATNLRVIARTGVGVESVDVAAATSRGIPVMTTPGANSRAVSEGAFAMALALTKRLASATAMVREGLFDQRDALDVGDLDGGILGVVGLGHVGAHVARIGRAFGMKVVAYDPHVDPADERAHGVELADLDVVMSRATVLVACAPHSKQTVGLLDRRRLGLMPPGAIVINVGRGSIVDMDVLADMVASGQLGGVGLDVFDPEPPRSDHRLLSYPNVVLSPHVFGLSVRARHEMYRRIADGLIAVFDGGRPAGVVNPEAYNP